MPFTIETEKPVYRSRDRIHGIVTLQSGTSEPIHFVTITLNGNSKVKLIKDTGTGARTYNSKQLLCSQSITANADEQTLPPGSHSFRFEIPLPSHCDRNQRDDGLQAGSPFFGGRDKHILPPTFSYSVADLEAEFDCSVEYVLEAVINRPASITDLSPIKAERALHFVPSRPSLPEPEWKMIRNTFIVNSLRLLPDKANARLSVRERVRSTFKSKDLPSATFHAVLWLPVRIMQGDPCPVRIAIRYGDTTAPVHPTVKLRHAKIEARTHVDVRTRSSIGDYRTGYLQSQTILDKRDLNIEIPAGLSDTTAADSYELDLSDICIDTNALYLDFATTNIAVSSQLEVDLQIQCADKKFHVEGRSPFEILPPRQEIGIAK